ncbi:MAG: SDR family NAD(P)-dependent oxidoreductase [Comamonadaceae bacterium]|nr:MAG: SDR family NAD(P)-dependent oxidoreductase [Comamonadaceae bacterium]
MGRLDNLSVLVTGGAAGMGAAITREFVRQGAHVTIMDRSPEKLEHLSREMGSVIRTVVGDVTSAADNDEAVMTALDAFGGLNVFVGNAGIWDFGRTLRDTPVVELAAGFDELFAVNVKGYLLGAKAAAEALHAAKGSMIFTLSNAAVAPGGGGLLYTASKHAGVGIVRQLAYELAPHVRVNAVAPGGMATDLSGPSAMGLGQESLQTSVPIDEVMRQTSALRRAATPEDYLGAYVLLAAPTESSTITGTVLDASSVLTPPRSHALDPTSH